MKKILIFLLLIITAILAGCSASTSESEILPTNTEPESQENHSEMDMATSETANENTENTVIDLTQETSEVIVVELDAFNFGYSIKEIRAKVGQTVKVIMTNTGGNHDFVIDELGVKTPIIKTDEVTEVEFIVTEAGEFEYYCSVGSHRAAGMVGKLIVTE